VSETFNRRNTLGEDETFRINPLSIPGVKESGWGWVDHEELIKAKEVSFLLECQNVIELMKKHQSSWPFLEPILPENVPNYLSIIRDPIDIKTIEKRLSNNEYQDRAQFVEDITRIFKNCRAFNHPETTYYKSANELEDYIRPHLKALK
jgi:histone acetyltransferase